MQRAAHNGDAGTDKDGHFPSQSITSEDVDDGSENGTALEGGYYTPRHRVVRVVKVSDELGLADRRGDDTTVISEKKAYSSSPELLMSFHL